MRDAPNDSAWVDATNELAKYYLDVHLEGVIQLAQNAYVTAADIRYHEGVCRSYLILSKYYSRKGELESALGAIDVATAAAHKCKNKGFLAECYYQRGQTHFIDGNVKKQLDFHQKALKIRRSLGDKIALSDSYNGVASIHYYQENDSLAKVYFEYALALRASMNDQAGIAGSYNNLALVAKRQGDTRKYFELMRKALAINKSLGNKRSEATNLGNMGVMYIDLDQLDSAWVLSKACFDIRKKNGFTDHLAGSYKDLGHILNLQERHDAAIPQLYSGLFLSKSNQNHDLSIEIYKELVKSYMGIGNEDSVKLLSTQLVELKDSLDKMNANIDLDSFQKEIEPVKGEQTSEENPSEESEDGSTRTYLIILAALVVTILLFFVVRRKAS